MFSVKNSGFFDANVTKQCPENSKMLVDISFSVFEKLFKYSCSDTKVLGTKTSLCYNGIYE